MATDDIPTDLPALPAGRFEGILAFRGLVRLTLEHAAREGWREIVFCDASFEDWPLGDRAVADALQRWSGHGRKFTMVAKRYDELMRRHARFVTWRRTWAHIIDCRSCSAADEAELPSAIWTPGWVMNRLDRVRNTGISGAEPERRVLLREQLEEWLRRSSAGFPASTLGL